jgi:hypothetical protein
MWVTRAPRQRAPARPGGRRRSRAAGHRPRAGPGRRAARTHRPARRPGTAGRRWRPAEQHVRPSAACLACSRADSMPSVTKKVVPPSISSGSRGWWVSTRPACGREGPRPTSRSTAVLGPGAGPAPNILRPSTGRADVRLRLLHHRRARVDLATVLALLPAPHIEREDPLVQLHAADAERVLLTLVGPSDVSVERHRQLEPERAHRTLLGFRGSRDGHFSWVISQPSTTPRNQRPTAHPREPVDAATWRRILLDQPQRNETTSQVRHTLPRN